VNGLLQANGLSQFRLQERELNYFEVDQLIRDWAAAHDRPYAAPNNIRSHTPDPEHTIVPTIWSSVTLSTTVRQQNWSQKYAAYATLHGLTGDSDLELHKGASSDLWKTPVSMVGSKK
jgi:hypothetical protein